MKRSELNNTMPIEDLQGYVAGLGDNLRPRALKLLKETRQEQASLSKSITRKRIRDLAAQYDNLYLEFIEFDHWVSTYTGMASKPWMTDDETGETTRQNIEVASLLNISAQGLLSERETMRALLGDISSQLNGLNSEAINKLYIFMSIVSLLIAFVSLIISLVALRK